MASTVPPRDWTEIRWPDIGKADAARWIAVLPLAATEQHGPHLPLETDVLIGEAYLARVRELLPVALPVTFLPLQPVGISTEHIDYPGTLTLPTDVALKEWMAIGKSVAQAGVRKLVIVTSHGGNSAAMAGHDHQLADAGLRDTLTDRHPLLQCDIGRQRQRARIIDMFGGNADRLQRQKGDGK